jgi:hypothetical protein
MGGEKTTTTQSTQVEATPEEQELNRLALENARAINPQLQEVQQGSLGLATDFLGGLQTGTAQSPILNQLLAGFDPNVIDDLVQKSIADVRPGLQASGLLDSGVRAELETQTAADIRSSAEQFNLNNLFNLLNISQGQAAQVQQPILAGSGQLSQSLAGLRSTTGTGTSVGMNPFLRSFQQGAGQSLGQGIGQGVGNFFFKPTTG